jgi:type II secretory ATPase GspE/PulE/Tfp pilus assembly ATPase PilB-like protein
VWLVPTIVYVRERNKTVQEHEKVWTHDHLALVTATLLSKVGVKMKVQKRAVYEGGVPVEVKPTGKKLDKATLDARLILSRNSPGFNDFRAYVYDGILRNADSIMFDFTPQNTLVRHQIDGVWIEIVNVPRSTDKGKQKDKLEFALEAGKLLVGANVEDRRSRQGGTFTATVQKTKYNCEFMSQGTQTGEAVVIQLSRDKVAFKSLEDVGMNPAFQDKLRANLNSQKGFFIISAPPANGLRSSTDVFIRSSDRFTRDVTAVEDEQNKYNEIENVLMMRYDSAKGETPFTLLPDIFFKEPHAVIIRDMVNTESLNLCLKEINNNRLIITTIRAKDAAEAILRIAAMKADMQLYAAGLNGVICQRLVRKLCPDCKEPFQPSPQLLQSLGFPPNSVPQLYRVRQPLPEDQERKRKPCETCGDIGYYGRTAMFEIIEVNDEIRSILATKPDIQSIRQAAIKSRQPSIMQYGAHLVRTGVTSVEELSRVLKL